MWLFHQGNRVADQYDESNHEHNQLFVLYHTRAAASLGLYKTLDFEKLPGE